MPNNTYCYSFGGVSFRLEAPDFKESEKLSLFRIENTACDCLYTLSLEDELKAPEGTLLTKAGYEAFYKTQSGIVRAFYDEKHDSRLILTDAESPSLHRILFRRDSTDYFSTNLILKLLNIPRQIIDFGGVFLHSSFIAYQGKAILFTGQKQIGKSTQAALWKAHRGAEIVNGDRTLIRKTEGEYRAFGSPYCGTSDICLKRELPLSAVVILSQGEANTVRPASIRESFAAMLDGSTFDTWDKQKTASAATICGDIAAEVPFYHLTCTPDENAVKALEEIL